MEQLYAAGHSPHGRGFTGNGLHGGKENYVGGWKVITCCTVSTPRDVSTSQPLRKNNSPQLGWGQILLQAAPRSPVKNQKELWPAYHLEHWALSQLSLVFLTRPVFLAGPCHPLYTLPSPGLVSVKFPRPRGKKWERQACTLFSTRWVCGGGEGNFPLPSGFFWLA